MAREEDVGIDCTNCLGRAGYGGLEGGDEDVGRCERGGEDQRGCEDWAHGRDMCGCVGMPTGSGSKGAPLRGGMQSAVLVKR